MNNGRLHQMLLSALPFGAMLTIASFVLASVLAISTIKEANTGRSTNCRIIREFIDSNVALRDSQSEVTESSVQHRVDGIMAANRLLTLLGDIKGRTQTQPVARAFVNTFSSYLETWIRLQDTLSANSEKSLADAEKALSTWRRLQKDLHCG